MFLPSARWTHQEAIDFQLSEFLQFNSMLWLFTFSVHRTSHTGCSWISEKVRNEFNYYCCVIRIKIIWMWGIEMAQSNIIVLFFFYSFNHILHKRIAPFHVNSERGCYWIWKARKRKQYIGWCNARKQYHLIVHKNRKHKRSAPNVVLSLLLLLPNDDFAEIVRYKSWQRKNKQCLGAEWAFNER